jgi:hypothetical protein
MVSDICISGLWSHAAAEESRRCLKFCPDAAAQRAWANFLIDLDQCPSRLEAADMRYKPRSVDELRVCGARQRNQRLRGFGRGARLILG